MKRKPLRRAAGKPDRRVEHIDRETDPDLFLVIRHIIRRLSRQKAQAYLNRMLDSHGGGA